MLDRTGKLRLWYSVAAWLSLGKASHRGETRRITAGVPVIFGPHMENFATLARALVSRSGAIEVSDENALEQAVDKLLRDDACRRALVQNAEQVLMSHCGATARTASLVAALRPSSLRFQWPSVEASSRLEWRP